MITLYILSVFIISGYIYTYVIAEKKHLCFYEWLGLVVLTICPILNAGFAAMLVTLSIKEELQK